MIPIIAVVGPTASGKTSLGIELAERLDTEIISADSMQFYRGMEIGTGAPTSQELARVKHHFVGFINPDVSFSAGEFQLAARKVVENLNYQGKTAIVVGGSGLYVRALIDGLFSGPGKDDAIRERLTQEATEVGSRKLYERLCEVDPDYADVISSGDLRRIVRGLEVYEIAGVPLSQMHMDQRESTESIESYQFAIDWPREELYERINRRVDIMIDSGLLDEVRELIDGGYADQIDRLKSLGYREIAAYIRGECPLEDAKEAMKQNTRRYAKRQLTWWRGETRIKWLEAHSDKPYIEMVMSALDHH